MQAHTIPSLQGTLAKPAMPTLKPNFAKEPFSPSRSSAGQKDSAAKINRLTNELKNGQLVTCYIRHVGDTAYSSDSFSNNIFCNLIRKYLEIPHGVYS